MSKLSYKTLLIIFLSLLIAIIVLLKFVLPKQSVKAAWWNETWSYRKAISINNTLGSVVNNQRVKITIDTSALITAGKMQSNCNDIRITDINGNILDHWDTACNTTNTNIYFKLDSLPTSGTTIYFYYGNSSASNDEKTLGTIDNPGTSCQMMKDQGSVTANGTYYIVPGGTDVDKQLVYCDQTNDGGGWTLVMNQNVTTGGYFANSTEAQSYNESNPTADRYSILGKLAKFKDNGIFTFKINWPSIDSSRNIWSQTSNPISENIADYTAITIDHNTSSWGGIAPSSSTTSTFIDGSPAAGTWYYAIASYTKYEAGIPPYSEPGTIQAQLWVKGNNTMNNVSVGTPTSEELSPAPIAYWKFDEGIGTTTYDSSSNKLDGNIAGATWQNEDQCINGKCLSFNGSSRNYVFTSTNTVIPQKYTLSVWVKGNLNNQLSENIYIFGWDSYVGLTTSTGGKTKRTGILVRNAADSNYHSVSNPNTNILDDKWHQLTATVDRNTLTVNVYVDGKLDISSTIPDHWSGSRPLVSGTWTNGYGNFTGLIDEPKIYSYIRTPDQVKQDYNSRGSSKGSSVNLGVKSNTAPSLNSRLVGHWKLNEGSGTNAYDSSTNQKNLIINSSFMSWKNEDSCKNGKCVYGNGSTISSNNYVSNFDYDIMKNGKEDSRWTLSAWVKPDGNQSGGERVIVGRSGCHGGLMVNVNSFMFQLYNEGCSSNKGIVYTPPNMTDWYYLSAVYDQRNMYLYVNGKLVGTNTMSDNIFTYNNNLFIGGVSFWAFKGSIDEVKAYNTALTPDEIKQDYNQGSAIQFGSTNQTIGGTTTDLNYCIPGDNSFCASPVAEWNFEENTGNIAKDTSGNNNNGTINGATWTTGKTGTALNFSISNTISVPNTVPIAVNNKITVSYWYKKGTTNDRIINRGWCSPHGWLSHGSLGFGVNDNSGCNAQYWASYGSMTTGVWYFLTGVFDGSKVYSYKNGILMNQTNAPNVNLTINNYAIDMMSSTDGQLDQVKIYNYARTPAQIAYDYNKGAPVAWWKFDECQGLTAFDASGFGNNGTINIGSAGSQTSAGTCSDNLSTSAWNNGKNGKTNSSLNFDGMDDQVHTNLSNSIGSLNNGSTSFWIYPKGRGLFSGNNQEIKIILPGDRPYIYGTGQIAISWPGGSSEYFGGTSLADNQWTHVTVVWENAGSGTNNGVVKIYYNGLLKNTINNLTLPVGSGTSVYIGGAYSSPFNGQMDDIRIYNYALTPEQIKQIYNGGAINFN